MTSSTTVLLFTSYNQSVAMEGRKEEQGNAKEGKDPNEEVLPSIQLISEPPGTPAAEGTPLRRDKRGPSLGSINNFIQKTYAILQEKQF